MIRPHHLPVLALLGVLAAEGAACKQPGGRDRNSQQGARRPGVRRASPLVEGTVRGEGRSVSGATITAVTSPGTTVTTGAGGTFSLSLPAGSTQLIRVNRAGARTMQAMLVVGASNFDFESPPEAEIARLYSALDLSEDPAKGILVLSFEAPGVTRPAGFGATLSVGGGTRFVVPESGPVRRDTTLAGDNTLVVANVPAGTVTVTPTAPGGRTCEAVFGVNAVRVDPRTITHVSFVCR